MKICAQFLIGFSFLEITFKQDENWQWFQFGFFKLRSYLEDMSKVLALLKNDAQIWVVVSL